MTRLARLRHACLVWTLAPVDCRIFTQQAATQEWFGSTDQSWVRHEEPGLISKTARMVVKVVQVVAGALIAVDSPAWWQAAVLWIWSSPKVH